MRVLLEYALPKRKEKTTLAVTATVSDSTAGISLEEADYVRAQISNPTGV